MNKIYLTGNLTKEPEIRNTQSGRIVARMSIAVNQGYGDKKTTDFFNLIAWEKTAELCGKYLGKGSKILVEGRLQNNNYKDDNGKTHYAQDVIVENLEFAGGKKDDKKTADNDFDGESVPDEDVPS